MSQQVISTSGAPEILIENIDGSLQVKGWEDSEVSVKASPETLSLQEEDDTVRLSCEGNCELRVPYGATLQVGQVHGDAHFKLLEDQLTIDQVHGSLILSNLVETQVNAVEGNLSAKQIAGDLQIGRVEGNATIRAVQGDLTLEQVEGNLEARAVEGAVRATVSGNAHLRLNQLTGSDYRLEAEGNIFCRIPEDAGVQLEIHSESQVIRIKSPEGARNLRQESGEFTLGDGEIRLSLTAGGVVQVEAKETPDEAEGHEGGPEFGEGATGGWSPQFNEQLGRQIESQINAQMEAITRQLNEQLSSLTAMIDKAGLSQEQGERILQQARESSERASAKAQERMRRAQEKLERKLEAARRREELHAQAAERRAQSRGRKSWSFEWPSAPTPPRPPAPPEPAPVSDEERLMILRMLEQKKITLEEAEQLLAALEGKEG